MQNLLEKKEEFKTVDLRGESMDFIPKLLEMLDQMKAGEGLHLIKEFEPVPLYQLLKQRGFIHQTETISADEYHVYLYRPEEKAGGKAGTMAEHIQVDAKRAEILADIVVDFFNGAELADLKQRSQVIFPISAPEFAYVEQLISERGISDTQFENQIENLIQLFKKSLDSGGDLDHFPVGHPIHTYLLENRALEKLIAALRLLIKNTAGQKSRASYWGDYLENLSQANNHYVRKENQLFPHLEQKGFDKPSTIMWTLHDNTRQFLKQARSACDDPNLDFSACAEQISTAIDSVADMIYKEEKILFPTAAAMLSEEEWRQARQGEIELDYCLIDEPPMWPETTTEKTSQPAEQLDVSETLKLSEGGMSLE
ncbi:MAG: hemerythrin domain-containing protein, partial [Desulfuromusa sp.]